jgi:hypothetical protein
MYGDNSPAYQKLYSYIQRCIDAGNASPRLRMNKLIYNISAVTNSPVPDNQTEIKPLIGDTNMTIHASAQEEVKQEVKEEQQEQPPVVTRVELEKPSQMYTDFFSKKPESYLPDLPGYSRSSNGLQFKARTMQSNDFTLAAVTYELNGSLSYVDLLITFDLWKTNVAVISTIGTLARAIRCTQSFDEVGKREEREWNSIQRYLDNIPMVDYYLNTAFHVNPTVNHKTSYVVDAVFDKKTEKEWLVELYCTPWNIGYPDSEQRYGMRPRTPNWSNNRFPATTEELGTVTSSFQMPVRTPHEDVTLSEYLRGPKNGKLYKLYVQELPESKLFVEYQADNVWYQVTVSVPLHMRVNEESMMIVFEKLAQLRHLKGIV